MRFAPLCFTACMLGLAVECIREASDSPSDIMVTVAPEPTSKPQPPRLPNPRSDRASERLRRPHPSAGVEFEGIQLARADGILDELESNLSVVQIQNVLEMPATACQSIEIIPEQGSLSSAYEIHGQAVRDFVNQSGFGFMRGPSPELPVIERVELVSLLLLEDPCVYVLHERPTPLHSRLARRRPLDEFELRSLDAIREGTDLVWTREAPKRLFGAIRADRHCLECHTEARENDLLGALTYFMKLPIEELKSPWSQTPSE
jgi:hypothetical protein